MKILTVFRLNSFDNLFICSFLLTYPIDHIEKDAVVCNRSYCNVKSCDNTEFSPPFNVRDECIARPIKQVAGDTSPGKCQFVPEEGRKGFLQLKTFRVHNN